MGKSKICFLGLSCATGILAISMVLLGSTNNGNFSFFKGDQSRSVENPYQLTLDKNNRLSDTELANHLATRDTTGGNQVKFEVSGGSLNADYFVVLSNGSYLGNANVEGGKISAIKKISLSTNTSDGRYKVQYGTEYGTWLYEEVYRAGNTKSGWEDINLSYAAAAPVNYFRVTALSGGIYIRNCVISYDCEDTSLMNMDQILDKETGDMLDGVLLSGASDQIHGTTSQGLDVDVRNTDAQGKAFSDSGYVVKYTAPVGYNASTNSGDAPYLVLNKSYDLTDKNLIVMVKISEKVHPDLKIELIDSHWQLLGTTGTLRVGQLYAQAGNLTGYRAINISNSVLLSSLASGKDLSDIGILKLRFEFSVNTDAERTVYVDRIVCGHNYYGFSNVLGLQNSYAMTWIPLTSDGSAIPSGSIVKFELKAYLEGGNYSTYISARSDENTMTSPAAKTIIEGSGLQNLESYSESNTIRMIKKDNGWWEVTMYPGFLSANGNPKMLSFDRYNQSGGFVRNVQVISE